eukprot:TRINITY_DN16697_c0_g1_i1.p1 TRINITY_DN16697_c0_g1~~TRINITY_DN16697_c0_g1_i1.p1  ORF type:complete len:706 (+),score=82.46 TRINITY_DN16697_c0_g1_i1:69-2186(+)
MASWTRSLLYRMRTVLFRPGERFKDLINPVSLCFLNQKQEEAFLAAQADRLASNFRICLGLALAFVALTLLPIFANWPTSGGLFIESSASAQVATNRNMQIVCMAVFLLLGILLSSCQTLRDNLSHGAFEILVLCILLCLLSLTVFCSPWYVCRLHGFDPSGLVTPRSPIDDANVLLRLDAILTAVHLALPLRWAFAWGVGALVVFLYVAAVLALTSPMAEKTVFLNCVQMITLALSSSIGKYYMELNERTAFANITYERVLRVKAEHLLETSQGNPTAKRVESDLASSCKSLAPTTLTDELFSSLEASGEYHDSADKQLKAEQKLKSIEELGIKERWLIPSSRLRVHNDEVTLLGRGGFGLVIEAEYHCAAVAVKASLVPISTDMKELASLANELQLSRRLRHPNIVVFFGACIAPKTGDLWLVMECVRGMSLDKGLQALPPTLSSFRFRLLIALDVGGALSYLHAQRPSVVHGDVKDSNVLLEPTIDGMKAKLTDFGLSRLMKKHARPMGGTCSWMAPEIASDDARVPAPRTDVFSFGMLFCLVATGRGPLEQRKGGVEWPASVPASASCEALYDTCVASNPAARPGMEDVCDVLREMVALASQSRRQQDKESSIPGGGTLSLEEAISRVRSREIGESHRPFHISACISDHSFWDWMETSVSRSRACSADASERQHAASKAATLICPGGNPEENSANDFRIRL